MVNKKAFLSNLEIIEYPSINVFERLEGSEINCVVLHFTVGNTPSSLKTLTGKVFVDGKRVEVSSHIMVSDAINSRGYPLVFDLVPEEKKAAHAGVSKWQGMVNLNSNSIGIEIVKTVETEKGPYKSWYKISEFSDKQIEAVAAYLQYYIWKYNISPDRIVGHNDIAFNRKNDPGPFIWKKLYEEYRIGAWYEESEVMQWSAALNQHNITPDITWVQQNLEAFGYAVKITGELDIQTKQALQAFMMRFHPEQFPGLVNYETENGIKECTYIAASGKYKLKSSDKNSKFIDNTESKEFMESLWKSLDNQFYAILDNLVTKYKPEKREQGVPSLEAYLNEQLQLSVSYRP